MNELKCPICGEPTFLVWGKSPRKDGLCEKHGRMLNFKQLALCQDCGEYYETSKDHICQKKEKPSEKLSKCAICDKETRNKNYLCDKHDAMFNAGEIEICNNCGTYYWSGEGCPECKKRNAQDDPWFEELPTEGFDECQCCGKKTNGYAFCRNCFYDHDEEELLNILNKESHTKAPLNKNVQTHIEEQLEKVKIAENTQKTEEECSSCIICGENTNSKSICKSCYAEVMNLQADLDKNKKPWELKDYYYNLKAFIGRVKDYQEAIQNLYKLYAIAWLLQKMHNDNQLSNVVDNDVKNLLKGITRIKGLKTNEKQQQNAKTIIAVADIEKNRASDGHICKSEGEVIIDDILFKGGVCHAYERRVKEIPSDVERSVIADWFIPLSGFDGIYIEYWGMATKDYQDNKTEKLKLYEKYADDVKLIEIEKEDIKDRQNLEDTIFSKLKKLGWHK